MNTITLEGVELHPCKSVFNTMFEKDENEIWDCDGNSWDILPAPVKEFGFLKGSIYLTRCDSVYAVINPSMGWARFYDSEKEAKKDFCAYHKIDYSLLMNGR